jgi:hypothetical protein
MEEKPITDKDNFPSEEKARKQVYAVNSSIMGELAYVDGLEDGYRHGVRDMMLYALAFAWLYFLAKSLNAAN